MNPLATLYLAHVPRYGSQLFFLDLFGDSGQDDSSYTDRQRSPMIGMVLETDAEGLV